MLGPTLIRLFLNKIVPYSSACAGLISSCGCEGRVSHGLPSVVGERVSNFATTLS
jgi:hypothetical protein